MSSVLTKTFAGLIVQISDKHERLNFYMEIDPRTLVLKGFLRSFFYCSIISYQFLNLKKLLLVHLFSLKILIKKNGGIGRKSEVPFLDQYLKDEITLKSLGVQVFSNNLKVGQHRDHRQFADVAYYGLSHKTNSKKKSIFNKLSENVCVIGVIAVIVSTQFPLERKHQFYFYVTLLRSQLTDQRNHPKLTAVELNVQNVSIKCLKALCPKERVQKL